ASREAPPHDQNYSMNTPLQPVMPICGVTVPAIAVLISVRRGRSFSSASKFKSSGSDCCAPPSVSGAASGIVRNLGRGRLIGTPFIVRPLLLEPDGPPRPPPEDDRPPSTLRFSVG